MIKVQLSDNVGFCDIHKQYFNLKEMCLPCKWEGRK